MCNLCNHLSRLADVFYLLVTITFNILLCSRNICEVNNSSLQLMLGCGIIYVNVGLNRIASEHYYNSSYFFLNQRRYQRLFSSTKSNRMNWMSAYKAKMKLGGILLTLLQRCSYFIINEDMLVFACIKAL